MYYSKLHLFSVTTNSWVRIESINLQKITAKTITFNTHRVAEDALIAHPGHFAERTNLHAVKSLINTLGGFNQKVYSKLKFNFLKLSEQEVITTRYANAIIAIIQQAIQFCVIGEVDFDRGFSTK